MKTVTRLPHTSPQKGREFFLDKVFSPEFEWFTTYLTDNDRRAIRNDTCFDPCIECLMASDTGTTKYVHDGEVYSRKDVFDIASSILEYLPDIVSVENKLLPLRSLGFIVFYILEYLSEQGTYISVCDRTIIKNTPGNQVNLLTAVYLGFTSTMKTSNSKKTLNNQKTPLNKKARHVVFAPLPEAHNSDTFKRLRSKYIPGRRAPRKEKRTQTYSSEQEFIDSWQSVVVRFLRIDISNWGNSVDRELYNKIQVTMTYARIAYLNSWKNPALAIPIL